MMSDEIFTSEAQPGRRYKLHANGRGEIEYRGQWIPARLVRSTYGTALCPGDNYPIDAITWVEYARGATLDA